MSDILMLIENLNVEELLEQRDEKEFIEYVEKQGKTIDYVQLEEIRNYFSAYASATDSELSEEQLDSVAGGSFHPGSSYDDDKTLQEYVTIGSSVVGVAVLAVGFCGGPIGVGIAMAANGLASFFGNKVVSGFMTANGDDYQKFGQYAASQICS